MRILDRTPKTSLRVVRKCESGYPQVIMNDLLDMDNKPFPTLYWLTCPYLIKRISRLESDGMIKEIEERIKSDSE
ncbi:MAG: DUF501 domain-containing protein, partial [Actinomycetia bacterium]|nr:DUF501 domain-containing protein [Actinomycetes bacterium]